MHCTYNRNTASNFYFVFYMFILCFKTANFSKLYMAVYNLIYTIWKKPVFIVEGKK